MKTLIAVAVLAIALMFAVTACNDRTRETCVERPTAPRCNLRDFPATWTPGAEADFPDTP